MTRLEALRNQLALSRSFARLFKDGDTLKPDAREFFDDLARFCRVNDSKRMAGENGMTDALAHVYRDGQRSVWDHISDVLSVDVGYLEAEYASEMERTA